ncbi:MAG TPA: SDR family oxidoreductase [Nocardioidaceae bacterium]|jgi:NAD(P)-dependent dehydrogenase (short-subunit alcohol dehydrogenase family)|nr:SDR family oxidoreductase [Nocardioidaceae bacterium]
MAGQGRVAVVTGGTAGVGRAVVRELAGAGYDVAVLARGEAGLRGAVADVQAAGQRGLAVPTDVADDEAVERAAEQVESELGEIYAWVNVAFSGSLAFFWDTSADEYRRMTEVTYFGQVHGTRAALRRMRPRDRGVIVNVGSAMAYRSIPLQSAYCGAKHAVKGFTESVITELAHEKSHVKVCMVQLPGLNTPQFSWNLNKMPKHPQPVPPIFQPELPARAVRFLVEHPRRNMWVGVSTAYTILGERLAPKFLDLYLGRTGVTSQQTGDDLPRRGSNVFDPSDQDEDAGAHGPFDGQAHGRDPVLWLSMHRRALGAGALAALAAAGTLVARRS